MAHDSSRSLLIAALAGSASWKLWFLQLSGWPVFLAIVVATILFMIAASVALTWLGNKSVLQSMLLSLLALTVLVMLLLAGAALIGR